MRVLSAGNNQRERVEIERGRLVVRLFDGGEEFVAETQVQSEARSYFDVIDAIDRVYLAAIINVVQAGDGSAVGNAEQEGGDGLAAGSG